MLEMYVMDSMVTLEEHRHMADDFKCRDPNCQRMYKYNKCRVRHKQKCHNLFAVEEELTTEKDEKTSSGSEDHIINYGCLHLSLGLLLRDAEDYVKAGDGDRLMRVWKFLTFVYRLEEANKYALAGLQEGLCTRIARDLRLE